MRVACVAGAVAAHIQGPEHHSDEAADALVLHDDGVDTAAGPG